MRSCGPWRGPRLFDAGVRRAYVVTSKEQFGVTRLYQAIIGADARIYRIFENWDEALAWLAADAGV